MDVGGARPGEHFYALGPELSSIFLGSGESGGFFCVAMFGMSGSVQFRNQQYEMIEILTRIVADNRLFRLPGHSAMNPSLRWGSSYVDM